MATAFNDPRLTLTIDDAAKFLANAGDGNENGNYDVIICDSSDPVGPAEVLFEHSFFKSMHASLSPQGLLCTQGECMWLHLDLIAGVLKDARNVCARAEYAYTTIPTYPSGQIGFILGTKDASTDVSQPLREPSNAMNLRYYSSEIHKAAFVLPAFAKAKLAV